MSTFLRELGLLETTGEVDAAHGDQQADVNDRQTRETMPRRQSTQRPRAVRRSSNQVDSSIESPSVMPPSPANLLEAIKSPVPPDRASPEPNCSICLGKLQNKSFTNGCLHMFCFTCLLQWSKIKAECPLCKQSFKSIIHTVRSMQDYEEYELPERVVLEDEEAPLSIEMQYQRGFPDDFTLAMHAVHGGVGLGLRPNPYGVQAPFRYRTTLTSRRRPYTEFFSQGWVLPAPSPIITWRRRHRHVATAEFRESIYVQDLWARPPAEIGDRYRDCTPAFYRANQAQVHRLVPWLNRELAVLFHTPAGTYPATVILDLILKYITRSEIRSPEFRRLLRPHIGFRTDHFLHEFYSFASSHFDLIGYDQAVQYQPNPNAPLSIHVSDDSDSDVEIISTEHPPSAHIPFLSGPSGSRGETSATRRSEPVAGPSSARDEVDECQVVGYVKPLHERTPEVIELSSGDEQPYQIPASPKHLHDSGSRASPDSYIRSSSATSSNNSSTSDYVPGPCKRKPVFKRYTRRETYDSFPSHQQQEEVATTSTDSTIARKRPKASTVKRPVCQPFGTGSSDSFHSEPRQEEVATTSTDSNLRRKRPKASSGKRPICRPHGSSDSFHSEQREDQVATTSTNFTRVRKISTNHRRVSTASQPPDLESSRKRAIVSYVRRNMFPGSGSVAHPPVITHPRMETLVRQNQPTCVDNQTEDSLNQSSSSVECLGSTYSTELFSLSPLTASPPVFDDSEPVSTPSKNDSIGSVTMPPQASEDSDDSEGISESDITLAVLKARSLKCRIRSAASWASTSVMGGGHRELKQERRGSFLAEPSSSAMAVVTSVASAGTTPDISNANERKSPKKLRSAVVPGTSTSFIHEKIDKHVLYPWKLNHRMPFLESDNSSDSDSQDSKPQIKSIVITRNSTPASQGQSSSKGSEGSSKRHKKKTSCACKHRVSSSCRRAKRTGPWPSDSSS